MASRRGLRRPDATHRRDRPGDCVTRNSVADNPGADDCLAEDKALFGLDDAELATHATVFAPNLCAGQVVLISGGGSGIGRASAYLYARLGARVVICGRRPEALAETAAATSTATAAMIILPFFIILSSPNI